MAWTETMSGLPLWTVEDWSDQTSQSKKQLGYCGEVSLNGYWKLDSKPIMKDEREKKQGRMPISYLMLSVTCGFWLKCITNNCWLLHRMVKQPANQKAALETSWPMRRLCSGSPGEERGRRGRPRELLSPAPAKLGTATVPPACSVSSRGTNWSSSGNIRTPHPERRYRGKYTISVWFN